MGDILFKIIWGIVGGTIAVAFVLGVLGSFAYMIYYFVRYGKEVFVKEFIENR